MVWRTGPIKSSPPITVDMTGTNIVCETRVTVVSNFFLVHGVGGCSVDLRPHSTEEEPLTEAATKLLQKQIVSIFWKVDFDCQTEPQKAHKGTQESPKSFSVTYVFRYVPFEVR